MSRIKGERRSRIEMMKDIVEYCVYTPKKISWISRGCDLSHAVTTKLLDKCVANKLLDCTNKGFLTTKKGKRFIAIFYSLIQMLGSEVPKQFRIVEA